MFQTIYNFLIGVKKYDNCGRGVVTIAGATPHTEDQYPFFVRAKTDAVISIIAIDGSSETGVLVLAGSTLEVQCKQVTAITSGTIFGII